MPEADSVRCSTCGGTIPAERLAVLPDTTTCVACSAEQPIVGIMVFDHKTAPRLELIHPQNKEALRRAERFNQRAR